MLRVGPLLAIFFSGLLVAACSSHAQSSPAQAHPSSAVQDLSSSSEWVTYGHDYGNQRYSPLSEITPNNALSLLPAYVVQTGVLGSFETSPIVSGGMIYISTPYDAVAAIDARTGDVRWKRPPLSGHFKVCCGPASRGVAVTHDLIVLGQLDGVLVALDRSSGEVRWAKAVANNDAGYSMTMAPLIVGDSVIMGLGGGEFGIRGSLSAYALTDGALRWRWYATDPQHWFGPSKRLRSDSGRFDERESAQLRKKFAGSWQRGGGGIWTTPAYDPKTNTIYAGTGNPWPDYNGHERPGDNLFTDCILALDASTGKMKWYFQLSPHDTHDHDPASPPFLFETVDEGGRPFPAVGEADKDGFLYILNRETGKLVRRSQNFVESNSLATHSSAFEGGASWSPVSFDPRLGYAIVTAAEHVRPGVAAAGKTGYGTVSAVDVATGKIVWQDTFDEGLVGGSVSTAGDVTFIGEGGGYFDALDTRTGARLYHFQTGAGVNAPPVAFEIDGHENVAVASGGNQQLGTLTGDALFVFRLRR
ncbi:MAG: pyrrolo-quinoline quinone [Candidatus Eremiobacteraeota bacterium]|nr:pyrrolo-quinoline quinone [Candidatus Eremiobacteraeota bacterium]